MFETSSSHVREERAFHAAPRGLQSESMQNSVEDISTADAFDSFIFWIN